MKRILLAAVVASTSCGSSQTKLGTPNTLQALMLQNLELVSDDDNTTPPDGSSVLLVFEPNGVADLYRPGANATLDARQDSYSWDGNMLSLQFNAADFQVSGAVALDLTQTTVTLPFRALSASAGSSTWQMSAGPVALNLFAVAAAELTLGASPDDAIDKALAYGQALVPGKADAVWPAGYPIVASVTRTDGILTLCYLENSRSSCMDVDLFPNRGYTPDSPSLKESPILLAQDWNELAIAGGVPSPHDGSADPSNKTALVFLPLKSSQHIAWRTSNNASPSQLPYQLDTRSFNLELLDDTKGLADWPNGFNYDSIETVLGAQEYTVSELADGAATTANLIAALTSASPGVVYIDTHGSRKGELLTSDIVPVAVDDYMNPTNWRAKVAAFAATLAAISPDLVAEDGSGNYLMFNTRLSFTDPNVGEYGHNAVPADTQFMSISLKPDFWTWLREKRGADFSRSLVYVGGCDTDFLAAHPFQDQLLRKAFSARAYFAFGAEVNYASANIFLYIVQHLARHTHTAEEAYYNVLRVLRQQQWVFEEDRVLDMLGKQACKPDDPANDPCAVGDREGLARNFHGYGGVDSNGDPIPFLDGAWLTDVSSSDTNRNPGNVWWLLFKSRWFIPGTGAIDSLNQCWNTWWKKGQLGGVGDTCTPEAPGVPPVEDELATTAYLLTGNATPFALSSGKHFLPRFTWNDGE